MGSHTPHECVCLCVCVCVCEREREAKQGGGKAVQIPRAVQ